MALGYSSKALGRFGRLRSLDAAWCPLFSPHTYQALSHLGAFISTVLLNVSILPFTALLLFWLMLPYSFRIQLAASFVFCGCPVLASVLTASPSTGIASFVWLPASPQTINNSRARAVSCSLCTEHLAYSKWSINIWWVNKWSCSHLVRTLSCL